MAGPRFVTWKTNEHIVVQLCKGGKEAKILLKSLSVSRCDPPCQEEEEEEGGDAKAQEGH